MEGALSCVGWWWWCLVTGRRRCRNERQKQGHTGFKHTQSEREGGRDVLTPGLPSIQLMRAGR